MIGVSQLLWMLTTSVKTQGRRGLCLKFKEQEEWLLYLGHVISIAYGAGYSWIR